MHDSMHDSMHNSMHSSMHKIMNKSMHNNIPDGTSERPRTKAVEDQSGQTADKRRLASARWSSTAADENERAKQPGERRSD